MVSQLERARGLRETKTLLDVPDILMTSDYLSPQWDRAALVMIDVQRDTLDGQPLEIPGTSAALPQIERLVEVFRKLGKPIVHVVRIYKTDGSNVDVCRRSAVEDGQPLLAAGSLGCEIAAELLPNEMVRLDVDHLLSGGIQEIGDSEVIIYKARWGAFYETPLQQYLNDQAISTLIFAGCNFPNCPRTSLYQASERDFRIVLASDALSGLYPQGLAELRNIGIRDMTTSEIIANGLLS